MPKKLTYEFVKKAFEERGYTLLEKEYVNNRTKMRYLCPIHGEQSTSYNSIKQGHRCPKCSAVSIGNKLKLSYEFVKQQFENRGYTLYETQYINAHTMMQYRCRNPNHSEHSMTYNDLQSGGSCPECCLDKHRVPYEKVKKAFEDKGYILLSETYINSETLLEYLCPIHGKQMIKYHSLQKGGGCYLCGRDKQRFRYEDVKKYFEDCGYTLISKRYTNVNDLLEYLCPIHGEQKIRYADLRKGEGCPGCASSKGEAKIRLYLDKNNIIYIAQYSFDDLKSNKGYKLKFDFATFDELNNLKLLIEYQGGQHYKPVDFAGKGKRWAKVNFKKIQQRDKLKVDYCKLHDIPLLTIKYDQFDDIEDILESDLVFLHPP